MGPPLAVSICYVVPLGGCMSDAFQGGDTIGAGIDFSQNRAFFTKNGSLIGMATLAALDHY
jgi:hypothetical protein